jgi:hypothetical protein
VRRRLVLGAAVLALAALAAVAAGPSAGAPASAAACKSGIRVEGGLRIRTFCGKAHATVRVGSRRWTFLGGSCALDQGGYLVGIGRFTYGDGEPKHRAFWVSAPAYRDGTYRTALVEWQVPGTQYVFETVKLRLTGKLTKGTFAGKVAGVGFGSGSFSCK